MISFVPQQLKLLLLPSRLRLIHHSSILNNAMILNHHHDQHQHHDQHPISHPPTQPLFLKAADFTPRLHKWLKDPESLAGVPFAGFPALQSTMKGLRHGELSVITGRTGSGKTTFLSQLAIHLAKDVGVRTLFGSFEIPNLMLMSRMLTQLSGKPFRDFSVDELDYHTAEMHRLPIHFLPFFGSTSTTNILQSLESITYSQQIDLVILDNLQFFLSGQGSNTGDKWFLQEQAIFKIRSFATHHNVHVMLVVHPRKPVVSRYDSVGDELTIDSLAGSAKVSQEADNVFLLQRIGNRTRLDIVKNRFTGVLSKIELEFRSQTLRYNELNGLKRNSQPSNRPSRPLTNPNIDVHAFPTESVGMKLRSSDVNYSHNNLTMHTSQTNSTSEVARTMPVELVNKELRPPNSVNYCDINFDDMTIHTPEFVQNAPYSQTDSEYDEKYGACNFQ